MILLRDSEFPAAVVVEVYAKSKPGSKRRGIKSATLLVRGEFA